MADKERLLNFEELRNVTGGVLDDSAKEYISDFITVYKKEGSDQSILYTTGWSDEFLNYALSVWNSIKV